LKTSKWIIAAKTVPFLGLFTYLFFLSIGMMSSGMKHSFKAPLRAYLDTNASDFTELVSFVIGVLGTGLVQSSSTVTSMVVDFVGEGAVPLLIGIGIVHGANLGTSVTSSLVALVSETRPLTGNPMKDIPTLFWAPRLPGFHRAVATAVVHGMFNALMVTGILLFLEIPFGFIHKVSGAAAQFLGGYLGGAAELPSFIDYFEPKTYTKPVVSFVSDLGVPDWALVLLGFMAMFMALKGFSTTMRRALITDETDGPVDLEALGNKLVGKHPLDTFLRGLGLTILVQSSSATTSLVVPLAAMGLFNIRRIFPFIMGANIGTTVTALLVATSAVGTNGFTVGMTVALSHFFLNTFAVILVAVVPGLYGSILGATEFLADMAQKTPLALLAYLGTLTLVVPAIVFVLPNTLAWAFLIGIVALMAIGPRIYMRSKYKAQMSAVSSNDLAA
jgi:sodium-dependent phosphate cotransporter